METKNEKDANKKKCHKKKQAYCLLKKNKIDDNRVHI